MPGLSGWGLGPEIHGRYLRESKRREQRCRGKHHCQYGYDRPHGPSEISGNTAPGKAQKSFSVSNEARLIIFEKETARNAFKAFPSFFPHD